MRIEKIYGYFSLSLIAIFIMNLSEAHAVPIYDITYLSPPAGARSIYVTGINDSRQITGVIRYANRTHAFVTPPVTDVFDADVYASDPFRSPTNLYYRGAIDLGTLGGGVSQARDINNSGQVTGISNLAGSGGPSTAFVNNTMTNALIDISASGANGYGINDSGQVTGTVSSSGANNSSATRVINYDATGTARDINNNGQMTGIVRISDTGRNHAFLWDPLTGMTDIGVLFASASHNVFRNSYGVAINNRGQITGNAEVRVYNPSTFRTRVYQHAFVWDAVNGMVDLGSLAPSFPRNTFGRDINDYGQIVGSSEALNGVKAFLWENGVMYNLNDLINVNHPFPTNIRGNTISINNFGDIVADNMLLVRRQHSAIPEPAPLALLGIGLFAIGVRRVSNR